MTATGEQMRPINGVELCVETFGASTDPAVLLVHGAGASMLGWDSDLCRSIAEHGRFVIRFDNRDTGRSSCSPPGHPDYSLRTMADDAIGILDALDVDTAHLVGRSMAGAIVMCAAFAHPHRVDSLTLVGTTPGDPDLPPMSDTFLAAVGHAPDTDDPARVVDYLVGLLRAYSADSSRFDEAEVRATVEIDVARTRNLASALTNHFLIEFDMPDGRTPRDVTVPTLIVHGDRDPVFPVEHAHAMQTAVSGAELVVLESVAHELPAHAWPEFVTRLIRHTNSGPRPEP